MRPGISTEGVRSVGGYNYKGNGRGGFNRERERTENTEEGLNELKNTIGIALLL